MNTRSRKTKGFSQRLIALLLCGVCLLSASPVSAMASEVEAPQTAEESTTVVVEAVPQTQTENQELPKQEPDQNPPAADPQKEAAEQENVQQEPVEVTPAVSLYDRLMACATVEEVNAILDCLTPEEEAELDAFTAEQLAAMEAHLTALGYYGTATLQNRSYTIKHGKTQAVDVSSIRSEGFSATCSETGISANRTNSGYTISVADTVPAGTYTLTVNYQIPSGWNGSSSQTDTVTITVLDADFTITNNMVNTEVAYIDFRPAQSTSYTLTPLANGQTVKGSGNSGDGVLVFFIKPKTGYLLTEFVNAEGKDCDMYSVTVNADESRIQYFRNNSTQAQLLLNAAKDQGYLGYYGFTYSDTAFAPATYSTKAERPQMTVQAVADKTEGVKPGDTVTYTVTITPGHLSNGKDTVDGVSIESLTINGQPVDYSTLIANRDGTYTTTVTHQVTNADWESGDVKLEVKAQVDYSYKITVTDRNNVQSDIPTKATVPNEASVSVAVAPKNGVRYHVTHDPSDLTPPDITKTTPIDTGSYFKGDTVNVNTTYGTANPATGEPAKTVDDPANGGVWEFNGWYKDEALTQKAGATEIKPDDDLMHFYGKWTFKKYPTVTITIEKLVTGNMGSHNDPFAFTVTGNTHDTDGTNSSFSLKHGQTKQIVVNVGDEITVSEERGNYTASYVITATGAETITGNGSTASYKVTAATDQKITFTNDYDVSIDTGILLDSLPYVLILGLVVAGAVLLIGKRRNRYED